MNRWFKCTAATLALSLGVAGMAACGTKEDGPSGKIEGNYQTITDEQLTTALSGTVLGGGSGSQGGSVGGTGTASGFGLKGNWVTSVSMAAGNAKLSLSDTGNLHVYSEAVEEDEMPVFGGTVSATSKISMSKEMLATFMGSPAAATALKDVNVSLSTNTYLDTGYVYIGMQGEMKGLESLMPAGSASTIDEKLKIDMEEIFALVLQYMDGGLDDGGDGDYDGDSGEYPEEDKPIDEGFDFTSVIAQAKTLLDVSVTADVSDKGLKLKMSTGAETAAKLETVLGSLAAENEAAAMVSAVEVSKCNAEIYLSFDAAGMFAGFAINADVEMQLPIDATTKMTIGGTVKADFAATAQKVTLPAGISDDTSYEVVSLEDLMGLLGGM